MGEDAEDSAFGSRGSILLYPHPIPNVLICFHLHTKKKICIGEERFWMTVQTQCCGDSFYVIVPVNFDSGNTCTGGMTESNETEPTVSTPVWGHNANRDTLVTLARGLPTRDVEEIMAHRTLIETHSATRACFGLVSGYIKIISITITAPKKLQIQSGLNTISPGIWK